MIYFEYYSIVCIYIYIYRSLKRIESIRREVKLDILRELKSSLLDKEMNGVQYLKLNILEYENGNVMYSSLIYLVCF